jgi:hypothetical protein
MNDQRRKEIAKALDLLKQAEDIITQCAADELEYYENMPESIRCGEKGDAAEDAANSLSDAESDIGSAINNIESIVE